MAKRRMFSMKVVDTDAFMEMPLSSQLLYFHLAMRADDDGFVANPKKIMNMIGSQEDDYKVLSVKKFIIPFESGICVIKHWRIHNYIQSDRYEPTQYVREKNQLVVDKKTAKYSLKSVDTKCIQNVSSGKVRIEVGKERIELGKVKEISLSPKGDRGKPSPIVDSLIDYLTGKVKLLDGSVQINRRYAWLMYSKLAKSEGDGDHVINLIQKIIDTAMADKFHSGNCTSFRYLYYNMAKIVRTAQNEQPNFIKV